MAEELDNEQRGTTVIRNENGRGRNTSVIVFVILGILALLILLWIFGAFNGGNNTGDGETNIDVTPTIQPVGGNQ